MTDITAVLGQYYGLDWVAMTFGLSSFYLISKGYRLGFALQIVASILGCAIAYVSGQGGYIVSNIALIIIATQGYAAWSRQQAQPAVISHQPQRQV